MSSDGIFSYLDQELLMVANFESKALRRQKNKVEESTAYRAQMKSLSSLVEIIKGVERKPEALVAMDSFCVLIEKNLFAQTDKEHEKCEEQLHENMDAVDLIETMRDPEKYRKTIARAGINPTSSYHHKNAFTSIIDKRIQQMSKHMNDINTPLEKKAFYTARRDNLNAAKKLCVDLQKEAIDLQKSMTNQ